MFGFLKDLIFMISFVKDLTFMIFRFCMKNLLFNVVYDMRFDEMENK